MKIEELLRLKFGAGLSNRQIAHSCAVSRTTVGDYLRRAKQAGIGWPLPAELSEQALEQKLFPKGRQRCPGNERSQPDWVEIHQELRRKGVTLMLLWQEYQERYPDTGYQYSRFAQLYRQWRDSVDVVMRQTHAPGEKLFVDSAGQTVGITARHSGEVRQAEIFVASLGASNYAYAEATWTQGTEDWIEPHIHAFEFLQGCAAVLVPVIFRFLYHPRTDGIHLNVAITGEQVALLLDEACLEPAFPQRTEPAIGAVDLRHKSSPERL